MPEDATQLLSSHHEQGQRFFIFDILLFDFHFFIFSSRWRISRSFLAVGLSSYLMKNDNFFEASACILLFSRLLLFLANINHILAIFCRGNK